MSLLICTRMPEWKSDEELRDVLAPQLPGVDIYCGEPEEVLPDVSMVATLDKPLGFWDKVPNLQLLQKLGAGVNNILTDPELPASMRITRMAPEVQAREIAEYCLAAVLRSQHHFPQYRVFAQTKSWRPIAPRITTQTEIAVLGLGQIGSEIARLLALVGFRVKGWSRGLKSLDGIECHAGEEGLAAAVENADYVIAILPSTDATRGLMNADFFARLKADAAVINVGRGDLIVETDLLAALDDGRLRGAVLDVTDPEPLPTDSRLWLHDAVLITPHVAGWHLPEDFAEVAENYRRLSAGDALLHEVDRGSGY